VQNTAADENSTQMEVSHQEKWDSEVQRDETKAYSEDELIGVFEMEGRGDEYRGRTIERISSYSRSRVSLTQKQEVGTIW
jgi:hypothetical protein